LDVQSANGRTAMKATVGKANQNGTSVYGNKGPGLVGVFGAGLAVAFLRSLAI
jgi:hypothetical protein